MLYVAIYKWIMIVSSLILKIIIFEVPLSFAIGNIQGWKICGDLQRHLSADVCHSDWFQMEIEELCLGYNPVTHY